ncbi:hypothetical protein ACFPOE_23585 [Caenimonas terrae]|uniref:L,D-transpeptidase n=1 Tax=Caenimonas terrae TaxID=696074 RepID=A0ABW0NKJ3_9BURK
MQHFARLLHAALLALAAAGMQPAAAAGEVRAPRHANFEREQASPDARHIADWALDSGDNAGMPFVVVDKVHARVFVFGADGRLLGASAALLGLARGDDSVPGIGERKLSSIQPQERTTPAGRFVAALDKSLAGEEILWVDYDSGVAMHRVIATVPKERRLQRMESALPQEHRITFGCINVPVRFYEKVVSPAFTGTSGIVYVLPETRPAREVFGSYDVGAGAPAGRQGGSEAGSSR